MVAAGAESVSNGGCLPDDILYLLGDAEEDRPRLEKFINRLHDTRAHRLMFEWAKLQHCRVLCITLHSDVMPEASNMVQFNWHNADCIASFVTGLGVSVCQPCARSCNNMKDHRICCACC